MVDPNYVDPNGGGFDPNAGPFDPNQNGGEQMANVQPDPTQFSGGEIKISSGPDMPGDIGYFHPLPGGREREPIRLMLSFQPAGADPEIDPPKRIVDDKSKWNEGAYDPYLNRD